MERSALAKEIGNRIRNERKHKGLSQENLAFDAGIHTSYYGCIERGEKCPTVDTIYKISNALDIPVSRLLPDTSSKADSPAERINAALLSLPKDKQERLAEIFESIIGIANQST